MRVVAGKAGGIPLQLPPSPIRPTMDRVREAIFSMLGERVCGARALDLFAGAGSLGIEALSRGAASAVFVESAPPCAGMIRRNLDKCRLGGEVRAMDALRFLEILVEEGGGGSFDLVFADPPYAKVRGARDWGAELLAHPRLLSALDPGGLFILETFHLWQPPNHAPWNLLRQKRYGDTAVRIFAPNP